MSRKRGGGAKEARKDRALAVLRKSTSSSRVDIVVMFRLGYNESGALEVIDSEEAHWLDIPSDAVPEGTYEAVTSWVRKRSFASFGGDVIDRAAKMAINGGLEHLAKAFGKNG